MIKTVTVTANSELAVDITGSHCKVKNRGSSTVYASRLSGISAGADEVIAVDSGTADVLRNVGQYGVKNGTYGCTGKLYLLSDTDCMVEIQTADDLHFFKSGGSGGGEPYDDTAVKADISALQTGKADKTAVYTKSETDAKITEKVAEIVADAPEDFDTLKEMSDWIASHEEDASAMNSAILANTSAISDKVDKVTGKGLSSEDYTTAEKSKLAGLENYALPIASADTLGGVKIGEGLSISDGILSTSNGLGNLKIAYGECELTFESNAVSNSTTINYETAEFTQTPAIVANQIGSNSYFFVLKVINKTKDNAQLAGFYCPKDGATKLMGTFKANWIAIGI